VRKSEPFQAAASQTPRLPAALIISLNTKQMFYLLVRRAAAPINHCYLG
jgi:hypothetical protein